jgi:beta-lactamase regulating signal transducer with metallopeptidase domain
MIQLLSIPFIPEPFLEQWSWALVQVSIEGLLAGVLTFFIYKLLPENYVAFRYYFSLLVLMAFPIIFVYHLLPLETVPTEIQILSNSTIAESTLTTALQTHSSTLFTHIKDKLLIITNRHSAILFYGYLIGFLFLAFQLFRQAIQLGQLRKKTECITEYHICQIFRHALRKLSMPEGIKLKTSQKSNTPFTIGFFNPIVVLPITLIAQLPYEQVETIMLHELAHIKRNDYFINLIQRLIETLFFFHPMVWLLSGNIRKQRELLCDDLVMEKASTRADYAKALLATSLYTQNNLYSLGINGKTRNSTNIKYRIKRMIMEPKRHQKRLQWIVPIVMLTLVFTTAAFTSRSFSSNEYVNGGVEPTAVPGSATLERAVSTPLNHQQMQEQMIDDTLVIDKEQNKFIDLDNQLITTTKTYDGEKKEYKLQFRNGKVTQMWLNGKEIPKKEFSKHQEVIDDTKKDIEEAEETLRESMQALEDIDLDVIMKGVDASLEAVASIDWEGMMGSIEMALENLDTTDVQMELDKAFHALDSIDINEEISRALSEIDREEIRREVTEGMREARIEMHREMMREGMRDWNTDELREKMQEIRKELHNTDPEEIRKEMQKVQEQMRKMHIELRNDNLILRENVENNLSTEEKLEEMEKQLETLEQMQNK